VIAIVAHELAHIAVCEEYSPPDSAEGKAQEDIVFQRICEWGFPREAEKHRALNKRRDHSRAFG